MRFLQSLLLLAGALAVLSLGAIGASAAPREVAPCHDMGAGDPDQPHTPMKAMKAMACCVACVAAPGLTPAETRGVSVMADHPTTAPSPLPPGRRPRPEPGPPRLLIA